MRPCPASPRVAWLLSVVVVACGPGSPQPNLPAITGITASANPVSLPALGTSTLTATVTGTGAFDSSVNWAIVSGGGALSSATGASVVYTATAGALDQVHVTATSVGDPSQTTTVQLTVASPPIIDAFAVAPATLPVDGGVATLSWTVRGADRLAIDHSVGVVTGLSTVAATVSADTTFTLSATGPGGTTTATATVKVVAAPVLDWVKQVGTTVADVGNAVAVDAAGNSYLCGNTDGDFFGTSNGATDVFLAKFDVTGVEQWRTQSGAGGADKCFAVATDAVGNVFIAGSTLDTQVTGGFEAFVTKYDAAGARQWGRTVGTIGVGQHGLDEAFAAATDSGGNVVIAGRSNGDFKGANLGLFDAFVVKFDGAGTELWRAVVGGGADDFGNGVATDTTGNVYLVGTTATEVTGTGAGLNDAFLVKFDAAGTELYRKQWGTAQVDQAQAVATDVMGAVYVTGLTNGALSAAAGNFDFFLLKFDAAGAEQWRRQLGTVNADRAFAVASDGHGNVLTAGMSFASPATNDDGLLVKWNADGTELWRARINSLGNGNDQALGLAADDSGHAWVAGYTFDAVVGTSHGSTDAFVARFK